MKKIALTLALALLCVVGFSQGTWVSKGELTTVIDSLDLSTVTGSDTTIYIICPNGDWSMDIQFATVTGTGTAEIVAGHNSTTMELYDANSTVSVTGASGTLKFDDDNQPWRYLGVKITMSSITAGTLNATIEIR